MGKKSNRKISPILHVIKLIFVRSHFRNKLANVSVMYCSNCNLLEMRASDVLGELRHFDVLTPPSPFFMHQAMKNCIHKFAVEY